MAANKIIKKWNRLLSIIGYHLSRPRMLYNFIRDTQGKIIDSTRVSSTVYLYEKKKIDIGENVWINHFVIIDGTGGVKIGKGCQIGPWTGIYTHSSHMSIRLYGDHYRKVPEPKKKGFLVKPVVIGEYTFIGARSFIMPGVTIGKGCLIYAGSIVTDSIPDFSIAKGNPAQVIGDTRRLDARYLKNDNELLQHYTEWAGIDATQINIKPPVLKAG